MSIVFAENGDGVIEIVELLRNSTGPKKEVKPVQWIAFQVCKKPNPKIHFYPGISIILISKNTKTCKKIYV